MHLRNLHGRGLCSCRFPFRGCLLLLGTITLIVRSHKRHPLPRASQMARVRSRVGGFASDIGILKANLRTPPTDEPLISATSSNQSRISFPLFPSNRFEYQFVQSSNSRQNFGEAGPGKLKAAPVSFLHFVRGGDEGRCAFHDTEFHSRRMPTRSIGATISCVEPPRAGPL